MRYDTFVCLHAFTRDEAGNETYAEPDDENADGWCVWLNHRDPETGDTVDPEKAPRLEINLDDYAAAYLIADALACKMGWELREY